MRNGVPSLESRRSWIARISSQVGRIVTLGSATVSLGCDFRPQTASEAAIQAADLLMDASVPTFFVTRDDVESAPVTRVDKDSGKLLAKDSTGQPISREIDVLTLANGSYALLSEKNDDSVSLDILDSDGTKVQTLASFGDLDSQSMLFALNESTIVVGSIKVWIRVSLRDAT